MHDFGELAYLDLHKTGSTYVSDFLSNCCKLEQIRFSKHDYVRDDYRDDCLYFITIRNPLNMWSSLFRYGLDKKGSVYNRFHEAGLLQKYEDFNSFVGFCLDEQNADFLGFEFNKSISKFIGFMSFRFLMLSLQYPMDKIRQCLNLNLNLQTLESNFITKLEIRNEKLNEELFILAQELYPQYFYADKVKDYLRQNLRLNEGKISQNDIDVLNDENIEKLYRKEHLLMKRYQPSEIVFLKS